MSVSSKTDERWDRTKRDRRTRNTIVTIDGFETADTGLQRRGGRMTKENDCESTKGMLSIRKTVPPETDREARSGVTAVIDETSDTGSRVHGDSYVMTATAIERDKADDFADITKKLNEPEELKFHEREDLRDRILDDVSKLGPHVYSVTVRKPIFWKWTKKEQRNVHYNALNKLMRRVARKENVSDIHMIVDENTKIGTGRVMSMAEEVSQRYGKNVTAEVPVKHVPGKKKIRNHMIETNDFVVGATGKKYNHKDEQYTKRLGMKVDRSRLILKTRQPPPIRRKKE